MGRSGTKRGSAMGVASLRRLMSFPEESEKNGFEVREAASAYSKRSREKEPRF